ncbi:MAG: polysaccharide deacetylase family protein [Armatimonadota bacterium]
MELPDWIMGAGRTARSLGRWLALPLQAVRPHPEPGVVVLLYHRVGGNTRSDVDVTERAFEAQMRCLHRHCRVVSLDDVAEVCASPGRQAASDIVAITFDDGYGETYDVAYPVLRRYGLPATVYLPAMYVETRRPFDFGAFGNLAPERRPLPLTWEQAGEMARSGLVAIGSHTHTHVDLSQTTPDQAAAELDECDRMIQRRLGVTPRHFAYPWGRWSPVVEPMVAPRYATAALGGPGKNPYAALRPHRLWRYPVLRTDGFRLFRARMHQLGTRTADGSSATPAARLEPGSR